MNTLDHPAEAVYPIRTVSERTGVNSVTLRAWERRYGLIQPHRTEKGHRLYSANDIATIQRITELLDRGITISRVGEVLDEDPPSADSPETARDDDRWLTWRRRLISATTQFDDVMLERTYEEALAGHTDATVTGALLQPALAELTARWREVAHAQAERGFLHAWLRNRLGTGFRYQWRAQAPRTLLAATLPGEQYETGLLSLALALQRAGFRILLLGTHVPVPTLVRVQQRTAAHGLLLHGDVPLAPPGIRGELANLARSLDVPVFAAGLCADDQLRELENAGIIPLSSDPVQSSRIVEDAFS